MLSKYILQEEASNSIHVKNIHLHDYVIIFTKNCSIHLCHNDSHMYIPRGSLVLLEKRLVIDVLIVREGEGNLYNLLRVDNDALHNLTRFYEQLLNFSVEQLLTKRNLNDRVFFLRNGHVETELFKRIQENQMSQDMIFGVAYLLSRTESSQAILNSFLITAVKKFSEKVSEIILSDLKKKWKLSDISDKLNISEIAVRKKLEAECTSFFTILLDIRMNSAFKLLVYEGLQVNTVADNLGFSSVSYFIKTFRDYYGLTPKKLILSFRNTMHNIEA